MYSRFVRVMCAFMAVTFLMMNVSVPLAKAEMISTESAIAQTQGIEERATLKSLLHRADVEQFLTGHGVDVAEAEARIDAMSDQEIAQLTQQMEDMHAGAGGLGTVVGAAVLIFIILLITDIAGATDVFPFVNN